MISSKFNYKQWSVEPVQLDWKLRTFLDVRSLNVHIICLCLILFPIFLLMVFEKWRKCQSSNPRLHETLYFGTWQLHITSVAQREWLGDSAINDYPDVEFKNKTLKVVVFFFLFFSFSFLLCFDFFRIWELNYISIALGSVFLIILDFAPIIPIS